MKAFKKDIARIEALYAGRKPFYGELHDHSASGGTSDGKHTLAQWRAGMEALDMDFATILDHKQVRHMYQRDFIDGIFLGGTEPGTRITDSPSRNGRLHYNMIFSDPASLEQLLQAFEEFEFTGGVEGHFCYPKFTTRRFCQLIDTVKEKGGFFVHPHPKQLMASDDPLDYWFADETGLEVIYAYHETRDGDKTAANYKLWTDLLSLGKRVWATAGSDEHHMPTDKALTTVYAKRRCSQAYIDQLRKGDFVAGPVGVRMCVGDTAMGGQCDFTDQRLVFCVSDFHESALIEGHTYTVKLLENEEVIGQWDIDGTEAFYYAMDVDASAQYYRVEIYDATAGKLLGLGNPIWNLD